MKDKFAKRSVLSNNYSGRGFREKENPAVTFGQIRIYFERRDKQSPVVRVTRWFSAALYTRSNRSQADDHPTQS